MSGIENILNKIASDSNKSCEKVIEDATQKANEIKKQYAKLSDTGVAQIEKKAAADAVAVASRVASNAQLECRKNILSAKQQMVDEAFNSALRSLSETTGQQLVELIVKMATPYISTGNEKILIPKQYESIADDLKSKLNSEVVVSDKLVHAGFVVKTGDIEYNKTFEALIREHREGLEAQVVSALF